MKAKVVSNSKDEFAVVFFNTAKDKNDLQARIG